MLNCGMDISSLKLTILVLTLPTVSNQLEHFLAFNIATKGLLTSYSRVFPSNFEFKSKKLISCLFCSTLELSNNSGKKDLLIEEHILKNIYGFECLIAPYIIAHLKLSQFSKD
jgi:hypothetical protein